MKRERWVEIPVRYRNIVSTQTSTGESNSLVYIVLPSFQPSPETTIALSSDNATLDFNGSLQTDYCSTDKALYHIYYATADTEQ